MEKNYRQTINITIVVIIIAIILISAAYKTNKFHKESLYKSMEAKIIEKGLKCYNEEKCLDKKITLQELYDKEYLEEVISPINNEYINEKSFIEIIDLNEATFTQIDE